MTDTRVDPAPDNDTDDAAPTGTSPDTTVTTGTAGTGDGVPDYKALYEQTTAKLTKAEQAARDHKAKAKRLDELEAANQSEGQKAAARAEAAEAAVTALRRRAVDAEIRAAATGWADPSDAPRYLDDRDRYVNEAGEIDTAAIGVDLADVLTARPHLARQDGPRRPAPDPSQGPRQSGPAGLDAQIAAAEKSGDWATAITLKNQRLTTLPPKN